MQLSNIYLVWILSNVGESARLYDNCCCLQCDIEVLQSFTNSHRFITSTGLAHRQNLDMMHIGELPQTLLTWLSFGLNDAAICLFLSSLCSKSHNFFIFPLTLPFEGFVFCKMTYIFKWHNFALNIMYSISFYIFFYEGMERNSHCLFAFGF